MEYRKVEFYKELAFGLGNSDSLRAAISPNLIHKKEDIVKYLKDGINIAACGGLSSDIINPSNEIIGAPDIVTDGVWFWPITLSYYVEKYNISLNDEFILNMKKNNYQIPHISDNDMEKLEMWLIENF